MLLKEIEDDFGKLTDLSERWKRGEVYHSYIIETPGNRNNGEIGKAFAKALVCLNKVGQGCDVCDSCKKICNDNYEDLFISEKEGAFLKDEELLSVLKNLMVKPVHTRNIGIIKDGETMTVTGQNRLLKILEEPWGNSVIFLLCENVESILQTLISRSIVISLSNTMKGDLSTEREMAKEVLKLADEGKSFFDLRVALEEIFSDKDNGRKRTLILLDEMERELDEQLSFHEEKTASMILPLDKRDLDKITKRAKALVETRKNIYQNRAGYGNALKNFLLEIGG